MGFGRMGAIFGRLGLAGGKPHGGPFLLLVNATSRVLLANGLSRLLITGAAPAAAFVPTYYILGF